MSATSSHRTVTRSRLAFVGAGTLLLGAVVVVAGCDGAGGRIPSSDAYCKNQLGTNSPFPIDPSDVTVELAVLGRPAGNGIALGANIVADVRVILWLLGEEATRLEDADLEIEGTGVFEDVEWLLCPGAEIAARLKLNANKVGKGDIIVSVGGTERKRFSLFVAEPVAMQVVYDEGFYKDFEARLLDANDNPLYAEDILWQFVPFPGRAHSYANIAQMGYVLPAGPDASLDVYAAASRGGLSAATTVAWSPDGWHVKPE